MSFETQSYELDLDCEVCEDEPVKKRIGRRKQGRCNFFSELCDPIGDELKRLRGVNELIYDSLSVIPFFDDGDANLRFFRKCKDLSPTHSACISSQCDYIVGGELEVIKKKKAGFKRRASRETIDEAEMCEFIESLNPSMDGDEIIKIVEALFINLKVYGNAFLKVSLVTIREGEKRCFLEVVDCEKVRYHNSPEGEDDTVLISTSWEAQSFFDEEAEFVKVYPNMTTNTKTGTQTIMFHLKNKTVGRDYYSLPDSIGSMYFWYLEIQQGQFGTEGYASDFVPTVFFEYTSDAEDEDDEDDFEDAIEMTFTNRARHKRKVMSRRKNQGEDATQVHQFESNTNESFHEKMSDIAERQIIKTHNWHKVLLGVPTAGRLGNEKEFETVFKTKYKTVIRPFQKRIMTIINKALMLCGDFMENQIMESQSLDLANIYPEFFEIKKENESANDNNTTTANAA